MSHRHVFSHTPKMDGNEVIEVHSHHSGDRCWPPESINILYRRFGVYFIYGYKTLKCENIA